MMQLKSRALIAAAALLAGLAAGCSGTIDSHGHVARESAVKELQPGIQTREEVARLLGSPSSTAPFDDKTWYYIGQKVETLAFFKPEVKERRVLVVRFDDAGILDSLEVLSAEDGKQVAFVDRETPTAGHEMTFLEQLLGNVGRFNSPTSSRAGVPGGGF